ncbi:MAG: ribosomal protein S18-alanine N-acetyltransferase [Acidimicrobiia bacterium]
MATVTTRPMRTADLGAVVHVESESFTHPWTKSGLRRELTAPDRVYLVAIDEDARIVGYAGAMNLADDAHLMTVACRPAARRHGVATMLITDLLARCVARGARCATLEVRASNTAARALYGKLGFELRGIRRAYYGDEDAMVMWLPDADVRAVS